MPDPVLCQASICLACERCHGQMIHSPTPKVAQETQGLWVIEGGVGRETVYLGREEDGLPCGGLCPITQQSPYVVLSREPSKLAHIGETNLQWNTAGTVTLQPCVLQDRSRGSPSPHRTWPEVRTRQAVHRWVCGVSMAHLTSTL